MIYKNFLIEFISVGEDRLKYNTLIARYKHISIEAPYHLRSDFYSMESAIDEFINRKVDV